MGKVKVEKWVDISLWGLSESGVTKIWNVRNKSDGSLIGKIKWYGANGFRGYCFFTEFDHPSWALYTADCLRYVADFCDAENKRHRASKKTIRKVK